MMSQQQNPPTVSQSLLQEMGSEKTNTEADVKPFSIRQYALASRHRNILSSWPFPEKYLHMCLTRGIRDVLPPFGPQTSPSASLKGGSYFMHSQDDSKGAEFCKTEAEHTQDTKNECGLLSDGRGRYKVTSYSSSHEEGNNQHNCSVSVNVAGAFSHPSSTHVHKSRSPTTLALSKAVKDKRRRRRGRCKKRSMVDILAVARQCTLEEIYMMNKYFYTDTTVIEGCQKMGPFENVSKSHELKGEEGSYRKGGRGDHEMANNFGITGNGSLLLKFKFNGCNVNHNCGT